MIVRSIVMIALALLAACAPQPDLIVPTLIDLNAISTQNAAIAIDETSTAIAELPPTRVPLPATWTPAPTETPIIIDIVPTVPEPTPTPRGMLYYIFDGAAIAYISADGAHAGVLPVAQTGRALNALIGSPDGTRLAYAAASDNNTQEIFVTDLQGNSQQITQLGFARIESMAWQPNGEMIAFVASPTPDGVFGIFTVNADGTHAQRITEIASPMINSLVWNSRGTTLFYLDTSVYVVDLAQKTPVMLVDATGKGAFFGGHYHPTQDAFAFLRLEPNLNTNYYGNVLYRIETGTLTQPLTPLRDGQVNDTHTVQWSKDSQWMLLVGETSVGIRNMENNSIITLADQMTGTTQARFSPDDAQIAYVDQSPQYPNADQVYLVRRDGENMVLLTKHESGTIQDLVWQTTP